MRRMLEACEPTDTNEGSTMALHFRRPPAKIHALMWVYRGGALWHRALNSLMEHRKIFDSVVVSFNGPQRRLLAEEVAESTWNSLEPHILITPQDFTAVEHSLWVAASPHIEQLPDDDLVLLLAEDDLLNWPALLPAIEACRASPSAFLFGTWAFTNREINRPPVNQIRRIQDPYLKQQELIGKGKPGVNPVCISGLVMTARAFRSAHEAVSFRTNSKLLLNGVRMEYFMATQPSIQTLILNDNPVALIEDHEDRGSYAIRPISWRSDEALFQLWLLASRYPRGTSAKLLTLSRFVRAVSLTPSLWLWLPKALRHFSRTALSQ